MSFVALQFGIDRDTKKSLSVKARYFQWSGRVFVTAVFDGEEFYGVSFLFNFALRLTRVVIDLSIELPTTKFFFTVSERQTICHMDISREPNTRQLRWYRKEECLKKTWPGARAVAGHTGPESHFLRHQFSNHHSLSFRPQNWWKMINLSLLVTSEKFWLPAIAMEKMVSIHRFDH